MSFLGLDQSLNATGVCRIREDGTTDSAAVVAPKGRVDGERLVLVKRAVEALLFGVTHAAIEGYSYGSTGKVFELGEIGGVLKVLLLEREIPYVVVPPALVKKFATGNAAAPKERMLEAAAERGFSTDDDNQADAFFLAHIARAYVLGTDKHRREIEVLSVLRHPRQKRAPRRVRQLVKAAI